MARPQLRALPLAVLAVFSAMALAPSNAAAHGPIAPVASSYLARVRSTPPGLEAKVVDGDQRMWLRVAPGTVVVVIDYRGAPYLRFSRNGVEVNQNSAMYFLNQAPVAAPPPPNLGPGTPPHWQLATGGHDYQWHDGRLHALAAVALPPGTTFVGTWRIPLLVDGRPAAISGGLWYAADPSLVWFWPIAVLLLCVVAAWRVRRPDLDRLTARLLGGAALVSVAVAAVGRELHGRPTVSVFQIVELAVLLAFSGWGLYRVGSRRAGYFTYFVIALVALWEGAVLIPTLLDGFVLIALPAFVARASTVVALGAGAGLLLMVFRLAEQRETARPRGSGTSNAGAPERDDDSALELA